MESLTHEYLENRRSEIGISKSQLARTSGVSRSTVQKILSSEIGSATVGNVRAVADVLGVSLSFSPRPEEITAPR